MLVRDLPENDNRRLSCNPRHWLTLPAFVADLYTLEPQREQQIAREDDSIVVVRARVRALRVMAATRIKAMLKDLCTAIAVRSCEHARVVASRGFNLSEERWTWHLSTPVA